MAKNSGRRFNGDGTIRQRTDGRWEGRIPIGTNPNTGKAIYKYTYAKTQREVREKMKNITDDAPEIVTANGKYVKVEDIETDEDALTFGEWLQTWLKEYKLNSVSPSTYESYNVIIKHHLIPALGKTPITKLSTDQIQQLLNDSQAVGARKDGRPGKLATTSVIKMKIVINSALKQAVKNRIIPFNPTEAAIPPRIVHKEIRILSPEEQKMFLHAVEGHRLEALFKLALATGMRKGELMALTWDDIDFENESISVTKSANRVRDPHTRKTSIETGSTKSRSGIRQVPLLPAMVPVLEKHRTFQEGEKRVAGSAYNKQGLVFCSNVGTYIEPTRINTTLGKLRKKAGLEHINFHALRHTFATRALENGIPARVVQEILGHSDVSLTLNRYTHVLKATSQDQIFKMNSLFMKDLPINSKGKGSPEQER
jgi:integrase